MAAMLWSLPAAAQEEYRQPALENPESWSVVVIPDLQGYAKNEASQPIACLMTAWIADNIERLNVRMVLCGRRGRAERPHRQRFSGDLTSVRQCRHGRCVRRWTAACPIFATGNHDYTHTPLRAAHAPERIFPIGRNPPNAAAIRQFGLDSTRTRRRELRLELKAPDGKDYLS
ncbi:MAG: hypothetical protein ACLRM8_10020 [Alistipes sp.]